MNKTTYYLDLNNSFLVSVLIHLLILSLPLYYLPQNVKYVPIINLTPVELIEVELAKKILYTQKAKSRISKRMFQHRVGARQIFPPV